MGGGFIVGKRSLNLFYLKYKFILYYNKISIVYYVVFYITVIFIFYFVFLIKLFIYMI